MPENPTEISRGFFPTFSGQEERDLLDLLREKGFTPDKDGLKDFILEAVYPDTTEAGVAPEMEVLLSKGLEAVGNIIKKKAGL